MKNLSILALVFIGGRMLSGCSDDGIYDRIEREPETAESVCEFKTNDCDGGVDALGEK